MDAVALAAKHCPSYTNSVQDDAVDALLAIHISPLASGMVNEDPGEGTGFTGAGIVNELPGGTDFPGRSLIWRGTEFGGRDRSGAEHGEGGDHKQKRSHFNLPFPWYIHAQRSGTT
jgi:hypothetical protein